MKLTSNTLKILSKDTIEKLRDKFEDACAVKLYIQMGWITSDDNGKSLDEYIKSIGLELKKKLAAEARKGGTE